MKKFAAVLVALSILIVSAACADVAGTVATNGSASMEKVIGVLSSSS